MIHRYRSPANVFTVPARIDLATDRDYDGRRQRRWGVAMHPFALLRNG